MREAERRNALGCTFVLRACTITLFFTVSFPITYVRLSVPCVRWLLACSPFFFFPVGGTASQVAALEAEVAALRARNFPVLNEALKGLKARHGEYKAEVRKKMRAKL